MSQYEETSFLIFNDEYRGSVAVETVDAHCRALGGFECLY